MTKAELESKHLSELHALAAEAGVAALPDAARGELIEKLAGDSGQLPSLRPADAASGSEQRDRPRPPRSRGGQTDCDGESRASRRGRVRQPCPSPAARAGRSSRPPPAAARPRRAPAPPSPLRPPRQAGRAPPGPVAAARSRPPGAGLRRDPRGLHRASARASPPSSRGDANGPDPVALLIDPSPEELAEWRRDAPQAEIVAAGQPRHASDALAQAGTRACQGEDVILLDRLADPPRRGLRRRRRRQGVLRRRPRPGGFWRRLPDRRRRARAPSRSG